MSTMGTLNGLKKENWPTNIGRIEPFVKVLVVDRPDEELLAVVDQIRKAESHQWWFRLRTHLLMGGWTARRFVLEHAKRAFDLTICLMMLPFLLPVLLIVALAIKLDSEGPVLFHQERVGKWGKRFQCYKFRSMRKNADEHKAELMHLNEANGIVFKMKHDPRVTRVGRIIRKASIDELPQFLNVIKGEMSLVGPRPQVPIEVENYNFEYLRRLNALPGITGLQQIVQRTGLEFQRWVELDVQYIRECSVARDLRILLKTIPAVLTGRGAY